MRPEREEQRRLRDFFAAVHAADRVPPFERIARRPATRRVGGWKMAVVAAGLLAVLTLAWLVPRLADPGRAALSEEEQLALARELSTWRGPLDFLLETPGRDILSQAPSFGLELTTLPPTAGEEETIP